MKQLRVKISSDQRLIPEDGAVAVWRNHILLASKSSLYYYDLTEQFHRMSGKQEVETLELDSKEFHRIGMKSDWYILGIQEGEEPGECVLICEDDADSVLVFF